MQQKDTSKLQGDMDIEERTGPKSDFKDLLAGRKTGASIKDIVKGDGIARMQALNNAQYEVIDLPSRGWGYPEGSVLSSGQVRLKLPTGKNEALLSSQNLIKKGIMIDEFLRSLILENFQLEDLLMGDKNYLVFAARRMTYGNDYKAQVECVKCGKPTELKVDLAKFQPKETPELFECPKEQVVFEFTMPVSGKKVLFKLSDGHVEKQTEQRMTAMKKPQLEILIRTATLIQQIDGKTGFNEILKELLEAPSKDTFALRNHLQKMSPDINIKVRHECDKCYREQEVVIPLTVDFFWPTNN